MKKATQIRNLKQKVNSCMKIDRYALRRSIKKLGKYYANDSKYISLLSNIQDTIKSSIEVQHQREINIPKLSFQENLPIHDRLDEIVDTIKRNQVVILTGETGSGKTTQLPQICLKLGLGKSGYIGHTQPRRIAARSIANKITGDLNSKLGEYVGYKIRFSDKTNEKTYVKLMTDGILLSEIHTDPFLDAYDAIIIDEAHERSLNIDFLLGYCKRILPKRPDLKFIITSATIDIQRFSEHFGHAPIIEVSGRTYPVNIQYQPLSESENNDKDLDIQNAILVAVKELEKIDRFGDILVFLSTEREIRDIAVFLKKCHLDQSEILSLYSRLASAEQNKIFHATSKRRIILATNVAETSITIPGIKFVIDSGLARMSRYSYRSKVQRLPIEKISQSSANQRAGRCGRLSEGECIRLYSRNDFESRAEHTEPEILRTNLASVILQMEHLKLGHISEFPFIEHPDNRLVNDGYKLLFDLQAVDADRNITKLGRILACLPLDPKLGRMVIAANEFGCLKEILIITSALAIQDPRDRPHDRKQKADQAHQKFYDEQSDFLTYLNMWEDFQSKRIKLSKNQLKKYLTSVFLSNKRMSEWVDTYKQLKQAITHLHWKINQSPTHYESIHQAIISGLISNIGTKTSKFEYEGLRNSIFYIHPNSGIKKHPKWVVASELVYTTKLFARFVAKIDPAWIEDIAGHMVKKKYSEAHWDNKTARVSAFEKIILNGLTIVSNRKCDYGRVNALESRKIFIQSALVEQAYQTKIDFINYNKKQILAVEKQDAKLRRASSSVDDTYLFNFYDERIPQDVYSGELLEKWVKSVDKTQLKMFFLDQEVLLSHRDERVDEAQFPNKLSVGEKNLKLSYHFEPGHKEDGVSAIVPILLLQQLPCEAFDWLVPGLLKEKLIAMIKCLPKSVRKQFVPVPYYVETFMQENNNKHENSLLDELTKFLNKNAVINIDKSTWRFDLLPEYYNMNIKVIDEHGKLIEMGRSIAILKKKLVKYSERLTKSIEHPSTSIKNTAQWDFDELTESVQLELHGKKITAYPTIVDNKDSVSIEMLLDQQESIRKTEQGIKRLYLLTNTKQINYIRKNIPHLQQMCKHYISIGSCSDLLNQLIDEIVNRALFTKTLDVKTQAQFKNLCEIANSKLLNIANELCNNVNKILVEFHAINTSLQGHNQLQEMVAVSDIRQQLALLVNNQFIGNTDSQWLVQIPRYLTGIKKRLQKLHHDPAADKQRYDLIEHHWKIYLEISANSPVNANNEQLTKYRWMLEEMRISLFAQELKTRMPISLKRLDKQLQKYNLTKNQ